jgi:hypothetical protein
VAFWLLNEPLNSKAKKPEIVIQKLFFMASGFQFNSGLSRKPGNQENDSMGLAEVQSPMPSIRGFLAFE